MSKFSQSRNLVHARHTAKLANEVTRQLVQSKAEALLLGNGSKDILSLLGMQIHYFVLILYENYVLFKSRQMHPRRQAQN